MNDSRPVLYLASRSPRRAELLREAGITFRVISVGVDETVREGEETEAYCERLA
ncbi:MAG: Maf family protein, partial [Vicinamibacteria bacterium]